MRLIRGVYPVGHRRGYLAPTRSSCRQPLFRVPLLAISKVSPKRRAVRKGAGGKLRIGDNWNVITIIALSQNNPLKAIAEFVENSIDARAETITIIRGKERGEAYLKIVDDGEGIPRDELGVPDFTYVATHIGASLKRTLKEKGALGIQGEFGIGLLSFWTVGEALTLSSSGDDGKTWQMEMRKNEPGYSIAARKALFAHKGTELLIRPLLPGLRQLSGEKIQNYLAAELRDRIRKSGVRMTFLIVRPRRSSRCSRASSRDGCSMNLEVSRRGAERFLSNCI